MEQFETASEFYFQAPLKKYFQMEKLIQGLQKEEERPQAT